VPKDEFVFQIYPNILASLVNRLLERFQYLWEGSRKKQSLGKEQARK